MESWSIPVRKLPVWPYEVAGVTVGVPFEVVLVLRLRLPEPSGRGDLGHDRSRPQPGGLDVRDGLLCDLPLSLRRVEDAGPVARANVIALPVQGRRVVYLEEELQQITVGEPVGI